MERHSIIYGTTFHLCQDEAWSKKHVAAQRREESLSRDRIIEASIELLDSSGEGGLTFRALSERLATGPGAIYWHIANKSDLLTAACDAIVARTMNAPVVTMARRRRQPFARSRWACSTRSTRIRGLARRSHAPRAVADGAHSRTHRPAGSRSWRAGRRTVGDGVRVAELHPWRRWAERGQRQFARTQGLDRSDFLEAVSTVWSQLDPDEYPFTRSVAGQLRAHDDRMDFLAGIDLILRGIDSPRGR
jgi:AcrR family transcriptional regulator